MRRVADQEFEHRDGDAAFPAVLLIGPTGVGKTPLGDHLEKRGLCGCAFRHFDFGRCLRDAAARADDNGLTADETAVIVRCLQTGALLEDAEFPIARKLLGNFLGNRAAAADVIVLNGLPRHAGQADAIRPLMDVRCVIVLSADPDVIAERLRRDTGGDRGGRTDDGKAEVREKLRIFEVRTLPLLDHYRREGVRVEAIPVDVETGPEKIRERLLNTGVMDMFCK